MLGALSLDLTARDLVEILLVYLLVYAVLRFLQGTVAVGIARGYGLLVPVAILVALVVLKTLRLQTVEYVLVRAVPFIILGLLVVFQPELRHAIARLAHFRVARLFWRGTRTPKIRVVDEIMRAVTTFAERRIGALLVVERMVDLQPYVDTGVPLDAIVKSEVLDTIFSTKTILHDGAVVVRGDRLAAAGCLLPLTENPTLSKRLGTRHRAAIGLSEQSDAVIIVVSEETGQISVAERGELIKYKDAKWLESFLNVVFSERRAVVAAAR